MATTNILNRIRQASTGKGAAAGFSLVEVLIAGVLLASMMAAVGRFSVSALTASSNQAERTHIEATINENMQLLHQADAQLTLESIPEADRAAACIDPALKLSTDIQQSVPAPTSIAGLTRSFDTNTVPGIAVITYSFEAPEQSIGTEVRVLELSANFQTSC